MKNVPTIYRAPSGAATKTAAKNFYYPVNPNFAKVGDVNLTPYFQSNAHDMRRAMGPITIPRLKQDIKTWRDAMIEAEQMILPFRYKMQQMYLDTRLNAHVSACLQKRKDLVLLKQFHICDEKGKTDDEATKIFNTKWFSSVLNYILEAPAFGYSLINFGDLVNSMFTDVQPIRRTNISPDRLIYELIPYSMAGIAFMDPSVVDANGISFYDWSLYVPTDSDDGTSRCGYGYLYKVALAEIILRNCIGHNADFVEMFGQPLRHAKTNKTREADADGYAALELAMQNMGSSAWLITDLQDEIAMVTGGSTGTGYKSYDNLETRMEKYISKETLGHADALDSTPGKLGGSSDGEESPAAMALTDKEQTDTRFTEYVVNDLLIPKLIKLGLKIPLGKFFRFKNDKEIHEAQERENKNAKEVAEVAKTMKEAGLKMTADYFTEKTAIPAEEAPEPVTEKPPKFDKETQNKLNILYSAGTSRTRGKN